MPIEPIPPETARVARAAFPKGNRDRRVADDLDRLLTDGVFLALCPPHGQPALPPWRLALVMPLQCAEGLSARQAANAVRSRIDWKDGLRLELTDPGCEAAVLSEFRTRLIAGAAESWLFETLLRWGRDRQPVKARGRQRTDSTHVLAAVRALHRIAVVGDTLRHALHTLAVVAPEWLRAVSPPAWRGRYARRAEEDRLPTPQAARAALTLTIGHDGWRWLAAIAHADAPAWLREVPTVALLRRAWMQHDLWDGLQLQWREAENLPPAARFRSAPDDPEAHGARQHTTQWVGDNVHRTDTCEDDGPHLIAHIDTTPGPASGGATTPKSHAALERRGLPPGTPIVGTGFRDADLSVKGRDGYGVELPGPTRLDSHRRAREGAGVDVPQFQIDGDRHQASGPAGKTSIRGTPAVDHRGNAVVKVQCSSPACRRCDHSAPCIRSKKRDPRRTLTIRPQPPYQALQAARQREAAAAFQAE